jgi:uncharacterized membrane protein
MNSTSWILNGFEVHNHQGTCPSADSILWHLGLYNAVSVAVFLIGGSQFFKSRLFRQKVLQWKPWSFFSAISSTILQILGMVATAAILKHNDTSASFSNLIQLWALRPRASWLVSNLLSVKKELGYHNGALDNVVVDVTISSMACVFVGRLISHALSNAPDIRPTWYWIIVVFGIIMIVSTAFETLWAIWILLTTLETKDRAEAQEQDFNSMKWIARTMVPLTCLSSWMIWAGFSHSMPGVYCPGNMKFVSVVWFLVAIFTNASRVMIEGWT